MSGRTTGAVLDLSGTRQVPLTRIIAVELRKMSDTRAGKWLLITIGVITVLAVGLLMAFGDAEDRTFANFLGTTATPQGFLLPVLGVLLVTSEWGQRATLTTFTLVPHRGKILTAKVIAAVLFGLAAIALAVLVAALAAMVGGASDPWRDFGVEDLGKIAILQTLGILQGLAFGMLFLNSAAAIVTYFVLPIAFSIVTSVVEAFRDIQPWVDTGTAQTPLFDTAGMSGEQWAQLLTTSLLWIALPLAVGAWRVLTSEVK